MLFIMRSLVASLFLFLSLTISAFACLDEGNPAPDRVDDALYALFLADLEEMGMDNFVTRFCELDTEDRTLAIEIFGSAQKQETPEDQFTLLRMAIMVPDISENVAWVAKNARIREEGDDWESISIKRFVSHVRTRFSQTQTVLNDDYLAKMDALYQAALEAVQNKEQAADQDIEKAKAEIDAYEKKIADLKWKIEGLKDERREYRVMRQTLEAEE
ncbi:hypothetical protein [uncultured Cohaesibacter sp.]|uniref:hypothetical protein n=1 Tax=uncultured Cohaesibacter sp. TaxID=1002546 RepID=UPI0037482F3F